MLIKKGHNSIVNCAARGPGRYAIDGVLAKSDGKTSTLVATNGKIILVHEFPDESSALDDVIIPPNALRIAKGLIRNKTYDKRAGIYTHYAANVTKDKIKGQKGGIEFDSISGIFPKYQSLITPSSAAPKAQSVKINARLLSKLLLAMADASGEDCVTLNYHCDKFPLFLSVEKEGTKTTGAIMPIGRME